MLCCLFLLLGSRADAFVLIGPADDAEFQNRNDWNYTDPWGAPKDIKRFFRWNLPDFTYSFDASFVGYFGPEGIDAVNDAFNVINDFFENLPKDWDLAYLSYRDETIYKKKVNR